jgi:hypothetical protein
LGTFGIGFLLWIAQWKVLEVIGIYRLLYNLSGGQDTPIPIISFIACYIIGAFLGDWIGKKVNYRIPLSP